MNYRSSFLYNLLGNWVTDKIQRKLILAQYRGIEKQT